MNENNTNVLDREEVEKIMLEIYKNLNITPKTVNISMGAEKGDGYLSFLTRVDVIGEDGNDLYVVIKCAPRIEAIRKYIPIRDAYVREIHFYNVIMPAFKNFQEKYKVPEPFANIPRCLKTQLSELKELLVLENIRMKGFDLWNRMKPMNIEHIEFVLKTYGKFHAISYAMQQHQPDAFEEITQNMFEIFNPDKCDPVIYDMMQQLVTKIQAAFADDNDHIELYEKLTRFKDGDLLKFWKSIDTDLGNYPVFRHGDCWVNNMMFKYDNTNDHSRPSEICLLDFQLARTGSPTLDLSYFLYVSAPKHLLDRLDDLLMVYYKSLLDAMRSMDCNMDKAITFDQLKLEWKQFARFGFFMSIIVSRAMMMEKDEVIDFTDISEHNFNELMNMESKNEALVTRKLQELAIHMHENNFF